MPALREELVTALLKALPKAIRKNVVPAADWARKLLAPAPVERRARPASRGWLADAIRRETYTPTSPDDFELDRVPAHLRMTFAAIDDRGKRLGTSKDLGELQARFAERTRTSVAKATAASGPDRSTRTHGASRRGTWTRSRRSSRARSAPAPCAAIRLWSTREPSVALRVFATAAEQQRAHPRGVRRLLALALPSPLSYVQEHLTAAEKLLLASSPYRSAAALLDDALLAVLDAQLDGRAPFTRAEFEALRAEASAGPDGRALRPGRHRGEGARRRARGRPRDLRRIQHLAHVPARRRAIAARVARASGLRPGHRRSPGCAGCRSTSPASCTASRSSPTTSAATASGRPRSRQATELYLDAGGTLPLEPDADPRLAEVRWMLEELRLSLFAQHLGAAGPVSVQRIRKALEYGRLSAAGRGTS